MEGIVGNSSLQHKSYSGQRVGLAGPPNVKKLKYRGKTGSFPYISYSSRNTISEEPKFVPIEEQTYNFITCDGVHNVSPKRFNVTKHIHSVFMDSRDFHYPGNYIIVDTFYQSKNVFYLKYRNHL